MTLTRHIARLHTPREEWGYPCPYCPVAFPEPSPYRQHVMFVPFGYFFASSSFSLLRQFSFSSFQQDGVMIWLLCINYYSDLHQGYTGTYGCYLFNTCKFRTYSVKNLRNHLHKHWEAGVDKTKRRTLLQVLLFTYFYY